MSDYGHDDAKRDLDRVFELCPHIEKRAAEDRVVAYMKRLEAENAALTAKVERLADAVESLGLHTPSPAHRCINCDGASSYERWGCVGNGAALSGREVMTLLAALESEGE